MCPSTVNKDLDLIGGGKSSPKIEDVMMEAALQCDVAEAMCFMAY
jgi:hypothetical protein